MIEAGITHYRDEWAARGVNLCGKHGKATDKPPKVTCKLCLNMLETGKATKV